MTQLSFSSIDDEGSTSADKNCVLEKFIPRKRKAEDVLNSLETNDTKDLSNDQLQRFLLLKQVKLVNLQIEKLEKPEVSIEFIEYTEKESKNVVDDVDL